ncbi:DUF3352 domain-containing protein [Calothrix sp. NIES-3974]|uniref:DUF3352 domain-containing protein n=1 Tax=Calothrix sp. NIES-3974 TaxID=2005462 RepID=UPI000B60C151|nr:DUF3352 domain-containing protein [Calothrix sp. NIES-3974]BAZ07393.1 hypothetical protein NIES3974_40560 [Calothrix sp. NIES-3974]
MNRKGGLFRFVALGMAIVLHFGVCLSFPNYAYAVKPLKSPGGAVFVAKQAPVMVSIFANPERIEELVKHVDFSPWKTKLLKNTGIDYRQDIQPWLGEEMTFAVTTLDIDRDASNGQTPGYLMALATQDGEKSREFLQLLFSQRVLAGADLTTEEYAGVKIIADSASKTGEKLAGAVVANQFVLFANDSKVLREAINNVQAPDLNLPSNREYQTAVEQMGGDAVAVAYLNLEAIATWQGLKLPVENFHSQLVSLNLDPQGIILETAAIPNHELPTPSPSLNKPVAAVAYLPDTTSMAVAGQDLSSLPNSNLALYWQQLAGALAGKEDVGIGQIVQPLAELQTQAGINLATDLFSWVNGEYAIGLLPNPDSPNPDWIFVTEKSPQTNTGIAKFDEIAQQHNLAISSFPLESQPVTAWTQLTTQRTPTSNKSKLTINTIPLALHTSIDKYEIFASSLEAMQAALTSPQNSLLENRTFKTSIANIPKPNQGYVYIDWNSSQSILSRQIPILQFIKILAQPLFQQLRSLTISSYGSSNQVLKGRIYLYRKQ